MSAPVTRAAGGSAGIEALAPRWRMLQRSALFPLLEHDPEWLAIEAAAAPREARAPYVVTVEQAGRLCAVAPFLVYTWRWPLRLGRRTVATVPVRVARLGGAAPLGEESTEAYAAVLAEVARTG